MLPDVYIAGFPKCGTTTISDWLSQHPKICCPIPKEPNVLSFDDLDVNEFSFFESPRRWDSFNVLSELKRYKDVFAKHKDGQFCLDATPSYSMSDRARIRIRKFTPNAKIIFILRHPTSRAVSHYWHAVRHRRASFPFLQHLRFESMAPLKGSFYMHYLPKWYDDFPKSQILVLTLDEIVESPRSVLDKLSNFLRIDAWTPNLSVKNNRTSILSMRLQLILNFIPKMWNASYNTIEDWGQTNRAKERGRGLLYYFFTKMIRKLGTLNLRISNRKPPEIDKDLLHRLDFLFEKENSGLSDLTGIDFEKIWKMKI